ncbi:MAG: hypothetical protein ACKOCK_01385 [Chloroflexota bacterium]
MTLDGPHNGSITTAADAGSHVVFVITTCPSPEANAITEASVRWHVANTFTNIFSLNLCVIR